MAFLLLLAGRRRQSITATTGVSETLSTTDIATHTGTTSTGSLSDTHATSDTVKNNHTLHSTAAETLSISDSNVHTLKTARLLGETITHTDAPHKNSQSLNNFVSETIPTNDSYATENIPYVYVPPPATPMPYVIPKPLIIMSPVPMPPNSAPGVQIGSVEVFLEYGQDFQLIPGGDFQLARDSDGMFTATRQRVDRLVNANPTLVNAAGKPIGRPTDLQNTKWGSGATGMIGERANVATPIVQRSTLASLQGDPGFNPATVPTVTVDPLTGPNQQGQFALEITGTLASGDTVTFPSIVTGG